MNPLLYAPPVCTHFSLSGWGEFTFTRHIADVKVGYVIINMSSIATDTRRDDWNGLNEAPTSLLRAIVGQSVRLENREQ